MVYDAVGDGENFHVKMIVLKDLVVQENININMQ